MYTDGKRPFGRGHGAQQVIRPEPAVYCLLPPLPPPKRQFLSGPTQVPLRRLRVSPMPFRPSVLLIPGVQDGLMCNGSALSPALGE